MKEKSMKNLRKKGISLIVLIITIIVIIILATAVIQSFSNNNPIEKAKEATFKNDVKTIQEELEMAKLNSYFEENPKDITIEDLKSAKNKYEDKFTVMDEELKYIADKLTGEEKAWAKSLGLTEAKEIVTFEKTGELKLGSEVRSSNEEEFYVIGGDTVGTEILASTQNIILLSKYNLKKENEQIILKQDKSGADNECVFSSTNYWNNVEGIAYPDSTGKYPDLNDEEKYPIGSATSVITTAKEYGASLGVTGRLMTLEEAEALQTKCSSILCGKHTKKGYLHYWLSSLSGGVLFYVQGNSEDSLFPINLYYDASVCGVRPVIIVSKSLIK